MRSMLIIGLWCSIVCASAKDVARCLQKNVLKIEWGVSGRRGKRPAMEDTYAVLSSPSGQALFSVYDGHGGLEAAYTAACNLPTYIFAHGEATAFPRVDELMEQSGCTTGTTAVTARVIPQSNGTYQLLLAWAGDSRAVLASSSGLMHLATVDHKPENQSEQQRIQHAGGTVYRHRYVSRSGHVRSTLRVAKPVIKGCKPSGGLSLTRALGDAEWPNEIISPDPEILSYTLEPGVDGYLILACDGLWDKVSSSLASQYAHAACSYVQALGEEEVLGLMSDEVACAKDGHPTHEAGTAVAVILAARALRDAAFNAESSDNITAMVVRFLWEQEHEDPQPTQEKPPCDNEPKVMPCCVL